MHQIGPFLPLVFAHCKGGETDRTCARSGICRAFKDILERLIGVSLPRHQLLAKSRKLGLHLLIGEVDLNIRISPRLIVLLGVCLQFSKSAEMMLKQTSARSAVSRVIRRITAAFPHHIAHDAVNGCLWVSLCQPTLLQFLRG